VSTRRRKIAARLIWWSKAYRINTTQKEIAQRVDTSNSNMGRYMQRRFHGLPNSPSSAAYSTLE